MNMIAESWIGGDLAGEAEGTIICRRREPVSEGKSHGSGVDLAVGEDMISPFSCGVQIGCVFEEGGFDRCVGCQALYGNPIHAHKDETQVVISISVVVLVDDMSRNGRGREKKYVRVLCELNVKIWCGSSTIWCCGANHARTILTGARGIVVRRAGRALLVDAQ